MRQSYLELVLLLNELGFLLCQVRPLELDHEEQQLILQTIFCDSEVDHGCLGLHLWWVVRVGQLCLHEEAEVGMQGDFLVAKFHQAFVASLDCVARDHGLQDGIDRLAHILNEYGLPLINGDLECLHHLGIAHASNLEVVISLFVLDPDNALQLWVNDETPSLRVCHDGAILARDTVGRQTLARPRRHLRIRGKNCQGIWLGS
mmetsp:Transcript_58220/g.136132  ORF Transcript_58220/g.136132 Transcript_58220/m.136132 type:complete len:203 (-) Transcript_58220:6247-6855(-)